MEGLCRRQGTRQNECLILKPDPQTAAERVHLNLDSLLLDRLLQYPLYETLQLCAFSFGCARGIFMSHVPWTNPILLTFCHTT